MTFAITGGAGFLGRRLVAQLLAAGQDTRLLLRPSTDVSQLQQALPDAFDSFDVRRVGLLNEGDTRRALEGCGVVFHLAAGKSGATAKLFVDSVVATRTLFGAAAGAGVRRVVLVSSYAVYDTAALPAGSVVDETVGLDPQPHLRDPYTFSKVAQETAAREEAERHGIELTVVRPGVITGPGTGALSSRVALAFGPLMLRMGGGQQLPYIDVDDCADAIARAGSTAAARGGAYSIVGDDLPTGSRILDAYRRAGQPQRTIWLPEPLIEPMCATYEWYRNRSRGQVPAALSRYKAAAMWKSLRHSNAKAKTELGWRPTRSFEEAFRRSLLVEGAEAHASSGGTR